jgi:hypothetical protein
MPASQNPEVVKAPFLRFLNLTGDGGVTGCEMAGNYAAAATDFFFTPPAGKIYNIAAMLFTIADNANFNQLDYGAIAGGLTNGIKLIKSSGGVETQLIGGLTVKQNYQYLAATYHVQITSFAGLAQTMAVEFDTHLSSGTYIELKSYTNDKLIVRVNDDLSSLVSHKVAIRGVIA